MSKIKLKLVKIFGIHFVYKASLHFVFIEFFCNIYNIELVSIYKTSTCTTLQYYLLRYLCGYLEINLGSPKHVYHQHALVLLVHMNDNNL